MMNEFEMTDLGVMKYFLGIQVKQSKGEIFISQEKYTEDLLKKFHMENCKSISTPMAANDKPDIVQAVSMISRFMNEASQLHFAAAKRVVRYLQGTKKIGIKYVKENESKLIGYSDSDWGGSLDDRKSTSGYLFCLGTNVVSWSSKKQKIVALSSAEAENIAATDAT
ncbi:uncharacterized protein LOC111388579 [Olea europaea var. sylvestris]|uniref:uncharacterized protein LOC111388579 n=1 Tax=Olea europaea var. sylvestris TaxID=158386 RepID=UPI000C1D77F6|nr:uncharacterized protein LOC111388579 [Olea europaea var. sylvestris]